MALRTTLVRVAGSFTYNIDQFLRARCPDGIAYLISLHFHDLSGLNTLILGGGAGCFRLGCLEGLALNSSCSDLDHDLVDMSAFVIIEAGE